MLANFIVECKIKEGESRKIDTPTLLGDLNRLKPSEDPKTWAVYVVDVLGDLKLVVS